MVCKKFLVGIEKMPNFDDLSGKEKIRQNFPMNCPIFIYVKRLHTLSGKNLVSLPSPKSHMTVLLVVYVNI